MNLTASRSRTILPIDWLMIKCMMIFMLLIVLFVIVNFITFHYVYVNAFRSYQAVFFVANIMAYCLAIASGVQKGYLVIVIKGIGLLGTVVGLQVIMVGILITTPFPLQDHLYYQMDLALGYSQAAVVQFVIDHSALRVMLAYVYNSLKMMGVIVGLALLLSLSLVQYYRYVAYLLITFLIGSLIYYFFPSTDVSSIIPSTLFSPSAYMVTHQFDLEHHYRHIGQFAIGLISMPSFHTIWAMVITLALWKNWVMRCVALCYTVLVIVSALLLGAHFLVDILAGIIIACLTWWFVVWLFPRSLQMSSACVD